ncbi:GNAT family N-acetyltransferase [Actinocorallia sp. API 0066]|uniref:GNAT family N-acetyltransferase n=1 Tax=Actinocorallia sp. API 0066 TaxID=2896846 RepID=UPI001E35409E|nr:GNAT family N-acetyltransferase [Actinocorallia sp. API 0066]MCD0451501.1 GNAT family N-acetyltransferase [Actinocorallia sp. API 0066]
MKHWPLHGLRVTTPRLELRLPTDAELDALVEVVLGGIHPPQVMPFSSPWTDGAPEKIARSTLQYHWRALADWTPEAWRLPLAVFIEGRPIGTQHVSGDSFGVVRHVETGSWLGMAHQGRGYGTEMRAAVLHLAFAGLGALTAGSCAHTDNPASLGVSRRLGYRHNGSGYSEVRGRRVEEIRLLLDRESWAAHRTVEAEVEGLGPCLEMFGLDAEP